MCSGRDGIASRHAESVFILITGISPIKRLFHSAIITLAWVFKNMIWVRNISFMDPAR